MKRKFLNIISKLSTISKVKLLKAVSVFSLVAAAGAISGASRLGVYQGEEPEALNKFKKF